MDPPPRLSERLRALADQVLPGGPLADIGADHGYLARSLLQEGHIPRAILVERSAGPISQLRRLRLPNLEVRGGDGLEPLRPGEAHSIVIAGMGARAILRILQRGLPVAQAAARLVVQPNAQPELLRATLPPLGLVQTDEQLLYEGEHPAFFMVWAPGPPGASLTETEALGAPFLQARACPCWARYLRSELLRLQALSLIPEAYPQRARLAHFSALLAQLPVNA